MRYQVKPGYTHGAFGQYQAGDVVELTEAEAAGFLDKLAPVAEPEPEVAETTPEPPTGKAKKATA